MFCSGGFYFCKSLFYCVIFVFSVSVWAFFLVLLAVTNFDLWMANFVELGNFKWNKCLQFKSILDGTIDSVLVSEIKVRRLSKTIVEECVCKIHLLLAFFYWKFKEFKEFVKPSFQVLVNLFGLS